MERALRRSGCSIIAGVDEVGRGAWAGPLVAAAAVLPTLNRPLLRDLSEVRDSKLLSPAARERVFGRVVAWCCTGVGWVDADEVDLLGLRAANELAMVRAVRALPHRPDHLVVDAFRLPSCDLPQTPIIRGDLTCLTIAAASIVAKVSRDRFMRSLDLDLPGYGFGDHKGYGTPFHRRALEAHGPSVQHRHSYAPVAALLGPPNA